MTTPPIPPFLKALSTDELLATVHAHNAATLRVVATLVPMQQFNLVLQAELQARIDAEGASQAAPAVLAALGKIAGGPQPG